MQQTSLEAWCSLGELSERQRKVLVALRHLRRASNRELAVALNWPINCVTPRVLELRSNGLVVQDGFQEGPTHRNENVWKCIA